MIKKPRYNKPNQTGRNDTEHFVKLTKNIYQSAAWRDLRPVARCIYIEIRQRYKGFNNGEIALSCRDAATATHCSTNTARRAFQELVEHGFIKMITKGRFTYRNATEWALTDARLNNELPTKDWYQWQPKTKDSARGDVARVPGRTVSNLSGLYSGSNTPSQTL